MSNNIKTFVFFDTETTGLEFSNKTPETVNQNCFVWELSVLRVDYDLDKNEIVNPENSQSKTFTFKTPSSAFSPKAIEVCRLNSDKMKMIENSPTFKSCVPQIKELFKDAVVVAYNGLTFDIDAMNSEFLKVGEAPLDNILIDPYLWVVENTLTSQDKRLSGDLMQYAINFKDDNKLATTYCKLTNTPMTGVEDQAHGANFDVQMLLAIFHKMVEDRADNVNKYALQPEEVKVVKESPFTLFRVNRDKPTVVLTKNNLTSKDALWKKFPTVIKHPLLNANEEFWKIDKAKFLWTPSGSVLPIETALKTSILLPNNNSVAVEGKPMFYSTLSALNFVNRRRELKLFQEGQTKPKARTL